MVWRILVGLKDGVTDARGERVCREIRQHLGIELAAVRTLDVYTVDAQLSDADIAAAAHGPFCDPVIQEVAINQPLDRDYDISIEVGFRPGVTDNTGRTAKEAIQYLIDRPFAAEEGVYTSTLYLLKGLQDPQLAEQIAADLLANGLIQRWTIAMAGDAVVDGAAKKGDLVEVFETIPPGRRRWHPRGGVFDLRSGGSWRPEDISC
ncbi:MAG: phosphoribosylformylglycinamidine synthase subunit PurS [Pelovirga sp.]